MVVTPCYSLNDDHYHRYGLKRGFTHQPVHVTAHDTSYLLCTHVNAIYYLMNA